MSAEIRSYLQNIDAEQMLECFHDGAYYFDFNLKKQIPLEERRKKSFSSGEGKNKATFKLTVYPSRLKGEFIRKGGLRCEILMSGTIKLGDEIKTI